jgi:hypothetical protein
MNGPILTSSVEPGKCEVRGFRSAKTGVFDDKAGEPGGVEIEASSAKEACFFALSARSRGSRKVQSVAKRVPSMA